MSIVVEVVSRGANCRCVRVYVRGMGSQTRRAPSQAQLVFGSWILMCQFRAT